MEPILSLPETETETKFKRQRRIKIWILETKDSIAVTYPWFISFTCLSMVVRAIIRFISVTCFVFNFLFHFLLGKKNITTKFSMRHAKFVSCRRGSIVLLLNEVGNYYLLTLYSIGDKFRFVNDYSYNYND